MAEKLSWAAAPGRSLLTLTSHPHLGGLRRWPPKQGLPHPLPSFQAGLTLCNPGWHGPVTLCLSLPSGGMTDKHRHALLLPLL